MDYGIIEVPTPEPEPEQRIPHVLRNAGVMQFGISHADAESKYGLWQMKCVADCRIRGREIKIGDTLALPGNEARMMVSEKALVFLNDKRMDAEARVLEEARKLDMPVDVRKLAAFARQQKQPSK